MIRWPWTSRRRFDATKAMYAEALDAAKEQRDAMVAQLVQAKCGADAVVALWVKAVEQLGAYARRAVVLAEENTRLAERLAQEQRTTEGTVRVLVEQLNATREAAVELARMNGELREGRKAKRKGKR